MIDTHSHLLPGVDHGCPDLQTSIRMARAAAESGIRTVVCTPHLHALVPADLQRVHEVAQELRAELSGAGVSLELLVGFEVDLAVAAGREPEELRPLIIEGTPGAIVLEMPYEGWPHFLEETLFRLATNGFQPVLAHPERNDRVQESPEVLLSCLKAGAVAQATVASITGEFGRGPERAFRELLAQGAIGLLATDAHAYRTNGWNLSGVLEQLRVTVSEEDLTLLVEENPRRLLAGEALQRPRSVPAESRRGARRGRLWS